jgi:hypothetical protein
VRASFCGNTVEDVDGQRAPTRLVTRFDIVPPLRCSSENYILSFRVADNISLVIG